MSIDPASQSPTARNMEENSASRPGKILVVDDDNDMRTLLGLLLTGAGFEVTEASDGAEGLHRLCREHFDLVVTDVAMPVKDGLTMIAEARNLAPKVKFIVHSGSDSETLERTSELCAGGKLTVLRKPAPSAVIIAAVKAALGAYESDCEEAVKRSARSRDMRAEANPLFHIVHECLKREDSKVAFWATGKSESRVPRGTPASAGMPAPA